MGYYDESGTNSGGVLGGREAGGCGKALFESEEEREVGWLGAGAGKEGYIWKIGERYMAMFLAEGDSGGELAKMGEAPRVCEEKEGVREDMEREGVRKEKERGGAQIVPGEVEMESYTQLFNKQKDPP